MSKHLFSYRVFALVLFSMLSVQVIAQDGGFTVSGISGDLRDISASGTFVSLSDDAVSGAVPIGFSFNFYGYTYTQAYISSNGFITFSSGQSNGCCSGQYLPDPNSPNNLVAGYWEDLNLPQGNIRYETLGSAPNREFVVGYYNNPHYNNGPQVTFEIVLHEGSNNVEMQYGSAPSDGGTHTVGVENSNGSDGVLVAYGDVSFDDSGYLLEPAADVAVPVLNGTGLALLVLLMGMFGLHYYRRHGLTA